MIISQNKKGWMSVGKRGGNSSLSADVYTLLDESRSLTSCSFFIEKQGSRDRLDGIRHESQSPGNEERGGGVIMWSWHDRSFEIRMFDPSLSLSIRFRAFLHHLVLLMFSLDPQSMSLQSSLEQTVRWTQGRLQRLDVLPMLLQQGKQQEVGPPIDLSSGRGDRQRHPDRASFFNWNWMV